MTFGQGLKNGVLFALPLILLLYKGWLVLKQTIFKILRPAEKRVFYIIANRYFVHLLIIIIATFAGLVANNVSAQADRPAGEDTLLFQAFKNSDTENQIFEDSGLPLVLEGGDQFFLDLPPQELEPDLPSVMHDQALAGIEVSPFGLPMTRTGSEDYYVQAGDTVSTIADMFGVSINTILWENGLSVYSIIRPDQKLVILPVTGLSHEVRKNDTVERLAKTYGVLVDEIMEFNNLSAGASLSLKQELIIPGGVPYVPPKPKVPVVKQPAPSPLPVVIPSGARYMWPAAVRRLTQYFSWRHPGIDIAGPTGTPLYASNDGVVILTEKKRTGYGWQIMIDHGNGFQTRYGHASQILVGRGQRVQKGQLIGLMGSTGRSTGSHLHFEFYAYGRRVNPFNYVSP